MEEEDLKFPEKFYFIKINGRRSFFFGEEKIFLKDIPKNKVKNLPDLTEKYNEIIEKRKIVYPPGFCKIKIGAGYKYFLDGKKTAYSKIPNKKDIVDITIENFAKLEISKTGNVKNRNKYSEIREKFWNRTFKEENFNEFIISLQNEHQIKLDEINNSELSQEDKEIRIEIEKNKFLIYKCRVQSLWQQELKNRRKSAKAQEEFEKERAKREESWRQKYNPFEGAPRPRPPPVVPPSSGTSEEVRRMSHSFKQIEESRKLLDLLKIKTKAQWKKWILSNHPDRNPLADLQMVMKVNLAAEIFFQNKS